MLCYKLSQQENVNIIFLNDFFNCLRALYPDMFNTGKKTNIAFLFVLGPCLLLQALFYLLKSTTCRQKSLKSPNDSVHQLYKYKKVM